MSKRDRPPQTDDARAPNRRDDGPPDAGSAEADGSQDVQIQLAFHRSVISGEERLRRSLPNLLATGFVGGMDVGVGVLALYVVQEATGSHLLAALAFSVGFVFIALAGSELFTENFLIPVTTLIAGRATPRSLARLWLGTFGANVAGGTILVALVVIALPGVHQVARELGSVTPLLGINARSFAAAMLGGVLLTLFTWVERSTTNVPAKLVAAMSTGFLVVAAPLNHSVVGSLEMAGGLLVGDAGYGLGDAAGAVGWAALGNSVGGLLLVTVLRLVQVGHRRILEERSDTQGPHERTGAARGEAGRTGGEQHSRVGRHR